MPPLPALCDPGAAPGERHGAGLPALNLHAGLPATLDGRQPHAWSRRVFEAPTVPDRLRYRFRAPLGGENIALVDRCDQALAKEDLGLLPTWRSDGGDPDLTDIHEAQR